MKGRATKRLRRKLLAMLEVNGWNKLPEEAFGVTFVLEFKGKRDNAWLYSGKPLN